jgi:hypothetical protein
MTRVLAPILREQFNKFYRYGYTFIPISQTVTVSGEIDDEVKGQIIEIFKSLSPFEYDEDYVIMELDKHEGKTHNIYFEIQNIVSVYPLSNQAKVSIENKIDGRIKLGEPIFEGILSTIERNIQEKESLRAIDALWQICDLNGDKNLLLELIRVENIFQGIEYRRLGIKAHKIKDGNYWTYLLAYDRIDYFPNSHLGFFYDAGQILAYMKNKPTIEGSSLHSFLQDLNSNSPAINFIKVISLLKSDESCKGYIDQTTEGGILQYIVAPLYLMLKEDLRNSDDLYKTKLVKYAKDYLLEFGNDFKIAVILLGAFFGYRKFYDLFYDRLGLRFYKSEKREASLENVQEPVMQQVLADSNPIILRSESLDSNLEQEVRTAPAQIKSIQEEGIDEQGIISDILKGKKQMALKTLTDKFKKQTGKELTPEFIKALLGHTNDKFEIVSDKNNAKKVRLKPKYGLFNP